jgi:nitroreductase
MNKIHKLITDRWSPVAFDDRAVEQVKIHLLFEAAKWAPSSRNSQPWRFVYATKEMPEYPVFLDLMSEYNQIWASTAPLLVMPLAQVISTYKNRPERLAYYEAGMAVGNLQIQAVAMGLFVHQLGGYDFERAREVLSIPARFDLMTILAIGYKGDISKLPEKYAEREERERTRKEIGEFVVHGKCQ